jgi:hypothetical protein
MFNTGNQWRRESETAAAAPEVGMGFHEMYSYWVFVVAVTEHVVQVVKGSGHPTHFPECGVVRNVPYVEFPEFVRYEDLADRRYNVDGWAARAEGITVDQLQQRVNATGKPLLHRSRAWRRVRVRRTRSTHRRAEARSEGGQLR